jgi:hypothetical protein
LLSGNETTSCGDGSIAGSELRDDEIGLLELAAWVCGRQKELDGASGKGGSLPGLSKVRQCLNGSDGPVSLLLAETVSG